MYIDCKLQQYSVKQNGYLDTIITAASCWDCSGQPSANTEWCNVYVYTFGLGFSVFSDNNTNINVKI